MVHLKSDSGTSVFMIILHLYHLIAWGTHHSTQRRSGQGTRGEKLFSAGKRQSEHILGHHKTSAGRDQGCSAKQRQGDRRCWRKASSGN